jgi:hypothetical protein
MLSFYARSAARARALSAPLAALAVLGALVLAAPAFAAQSTATTPPPTGTAPGAPAPGSATLAQADRSATFSSEMVAITGSQRMEVRVTLLERDPGDSGFAAVSAPGLGEWQRSEPGVQIYSYVKQVSNLPAPALFRASVGYRWLDAHGKVLQSVTRNSATCAQPDEGPALAVTAVKVVPVRGTTNAQYEIVIHNTGHGAAGVFDVALTVNGAAIPELTVASLAPAGRTVLQAVAPRCLAASAVTVAVDPEHQVPEALSAAQTKTVSCRLPAVATAGSRAKRAR